MAIVQTTTKSAAGRLLAFLGICYWALLGVIILGSHSQVATLMAASDNPHGDKQFLPRYDLIKIFSLGNERLLADYYWLVFIQYFGDTAERKKDKYKHAYDYLDLITKLDPGFMQAYWLAAFAIGAEAKQPDEAAKIIDRGILVLKDNWQIYFAAGANQYLFKHDTERAAYYYGLASKLPGAPPWLANQAELMRAKIPAIIKEIRMWTNIYESGQGTVVKETARYKLVYLWTLVYKNSPTKEVKDLAKLHLEKLGAKL